MALVRCPKHRIPYNDDNPRGCPACARESGRVSEASVVAELARASQMVRRPSSLNIPAGDLDQPVTPPPRIPTRRFSAAMRVVAFMRNKRFLATGGAVIVVLLVFLLITSGPEFAAAPSPAVYSGPVRPLPAEPNQAIGGVFAALGPQPAHPNPSSRTLERYSYGTDLAIDAHNGLVYAVTLAVPNRSWRGLQVGMNQTSAEGTLALLAAPREAEPPSTPPADTVGGYVAYRSLDLRPRRTLLAEVRPPNGCFDVMVDIQPRAVGIVREGNRTWAAVARAGLPINWVVTRIRVVSRTIAGPYAPGTAC